MILTHSAVDHDAVVNFLRLAFRVDYKRDYVLDNLLVAFDDNHQSETGDAL